MKKNLSLSPDPFKKIILGLFFGFLLLWGKIPTPIADYRLDACPGTWNGTIGEVKDSSGNNFDGTSNNINTTNGELCNAGDFTKDLANDYIKLNGNALNGLDEFSISMWIKTSNNTRQALVSGAKDNTYDGANEVLLYLVNGTTIRPYIKNKYVDITISNIADNQWHHIVWRRKKRRNCIYIDGGDKQCKNIDESKAVSIDENGLYLGQDQDSLGGGFDKEEDFEGLMDEVKIFDQALNNSQVSDIYDNEKTGKNYDGTTRECLLCEVVPIANYQMDECYWDGTSGEVKDSSDNHYDGTAQGGATTESNLTAGGILCHVGKFNGSGYVDLGNILSPNSDDWSIGVWVKWDGSSGEKIIYNKENLYEAAISGGKFYYAWKPHWHWDGGISLNANEWTHFVVTYNHIEQKVYKNGSLVYRRSQTGDIGSNSAKLLIGARGNTKPYKFYSGDIDELKVYNYALSDNTISSIYNNEKTGKNYDGSERLCKICIKGTFDAWDTFRSINDRNISTKIVKKNFDLSIASLNETGSDYQDFNGTVCIQVNNITKKLLFNDENISNVTLNIQKAIKDTRVKISWKKNVDENCPLNNEDNSTFSTDNFAIRPDRFSITAQFPFYAGDDFNMTFQALDGDDKNTTDYNETKDISFVIESNITKAGCYQGSLNVNSFAFQNGVAKDINASYSNIGDINITIKEKTGSEFAKVDSDDTNDTARLITPAVTTINVKPYDINVTNVIYQNSTGKSWLYDANVSDMNVTVNATIKAFAKDSAIPLPDFNVTCYAKDVNVSFLYDTNYSDTNISLDTTSLEGSLYYLDINNSSILIFASAFVSGEANASYAFNVKRVYNKPLNPVKTELKDINITTIGISKNQNSASQTGNINSTQNSTFYYGKTYVQDLETTEQNSSTSFFIDVYCNGCQNSVNSYFQDTLNWYRNELDMAVTKKTDIAILPKEGFALSSPNKNNISVSNITDANGAKISFDIVNSKNEYDTAILHVKIPRWLWYNEYKDYNDSNSSDCSTHPCIGYKLLKNTKNSIKSGTFKGSDIGHEQNRTIKKVGIKVYR